MKLRITFDVDERTRRAIADRYGLPGLADRESVQREIQSEVEALFESLAYELRLTAEADNA